MVVLLYMLICTLTRMATGRKKSGVPNQTSWNVHYCLYVKIDELKKRFEDYRRDYEKRKEHIREEASRKARSLIEDNRHLQKDLSAKKHEAQALVAEMEYTAEAFEEMQEQNIRLLQQVKV